jgi:hypothetical protein
MTAIVTPPDELTRAKIVHMILNGRTEDALCQLSKIYSISPPEILVGTIKGKRRTVYAVYVQQSMKIYATNSDVFYNPFVMLHEFYHHLRTRGGEHRGTERHANNYANWFITAYNNVVSKQPKAA